MHRTGIAIVLALTVLVGILMTGPTRSGAAEHSLRSAAPLMASPAPDEICSSLDYSGWEYVSEVPDGKSEWYVRPADSNAADSQRDLYLVIITLGPGQCIPYQSQANQKDGGVILVLKEGEIFYTWEPNSDAPHAAVEMGYPDGPGDTPGAAIPAGTPVHLDLPGQWISQNDQVWFTYQNPGPWNAVVWKVVWARPIPDEGCAGDCK